MCSSDLIYVKTTTITYGSILMMKVRKVKKDPNDLSLSIPSAILPGLNADEHSHVKSA